MSFGEETQEPESQKRARNFISVEAFGDKGLKPKEKVEESERISNC
jgi:hypothetical protein